MIICGTGHRPDKLGGHGVDTKLKLYKLACVYLMANPPTGVISGMALGWDQALAHAALAYGFPVTAAIPFAGQELAWPKESQDEYNQLIANCTRTVIISPGGFSGVKMQLRNQWMVNNADMVLALWDGSDGGTSNCIKYAKAHRKPIRNLWSEWVRL